MASVLPLFGDVALAAIFTFWFIPWSGSSRGGPTAGRRGDSAGVTSALCVQAVQTSCNFICEAL